MAGGLSTIAKLQISLGLNSADVARGTTETKGALSTVKGDVEDVQAQMDALKARIDSANTAWGEARQRVEELKASGRSGWEFDTRLASAEKQATSTARQLETLQNQQESLIADATAAGVTFDAEGQAIAEVGAAADASAKQVATAAAATDNVLERNRTSIQRLATSGSQLALVGSVIGGSFGGALGPVSEFLRVTGNLGLIASTASQAIPAVTGAATAFIALGTAQAASTVASEAQAGAATEATAAIAAEGAAATAAAGGFSLLTLAQGTAAAAAGVAAAAFAVLTAPITLIVGAGVLLGVVIHEVSTGFEDFHPKAQKVASSLRDEVQAAQEAERATKALNETTGEARIRAEELLLQQLGLTGMLRQYEQALIDASTATGNNSFATTTLTGSAASAAEAAETHRLRLVGETDQLDEAARKLNEARQNTDDLKDSLDRLPRDIDIEIRIKQIITTTNADVGVGALGGGAIGPQFGEGAAGNKDQPPGSTGSLGGTTADPAEVARRAKEAADAAAAARRKAQQEADAARRKAEQDARDLARAQIEAGREAFDEISKAAHKYFNDLHQQNLKAIDDARKAADEQIEQQKRANNAAVDALQSAFDAQKAARQLTQLQADVANAQTPEEKLRAEQALADFVTQQAIGQARAKADADNAALDTQKAAQDAAFDAQKTAEDDRYKNQVDAFDAGLAALQKYLEKHPAEWKKNTDAVIAVLKASGVDYQATGKANADAYLAGVNAAFGAAGFTGGDVSNASASVGGASAVGPSSRSSAQADISGLSIAGGGALGDVYLDSELVGRVLDKRRNRLAAIHRPTTVSTGSTR